MLIACLFLNVLAGCSALKLGYGQADSVTYWWLDGYLDFSDAQTPRVREHISAFWTWHRKTQLPDYAHLLDRAQKEMKQGATPAQVCNWVSEVTQRVDVGLRQMVPALVDVGRTLSESQLNHMTKKFEKVNEKFADDFLQSDRSKRHKAALKRAIERAESLYGSLNRTQRELLASLVGASPFSPEMWLAERKQRQQDILQLLRGLPRMGHQEALKATADLVDSYEHSPRAAYAAYHEALMQYNCSFAAQFHNSTTAEQRSEAAERLRGWGDDLRILATMAQVPGAGGSWRFVASLERFDSSALVW